MRRDRRHQQLAKRAELADRRLVRSPVFIMCPVRSGSTLLRMMLDTHPDIHAPHELHLRWLQVTHAKPYAELATQELGLDHEELEHMLWDRLLHRELVRSGKQIIVDKTPSNSVIADRLRTCWPDARFVILLRHPASVFASLMDTRPDRERTATIREALAYLEPVEEARKNVPGHVVRYEDLTADPERVTRELCAHLDVSWDPDMQNYGRIYHGRIKAGLGDWTTKIRTGKVQPPRPLPNSGQVPDELKKLATTWGYLP
ncbi:sulfotransferase family protein [Flindersiella endophytica]